eukprot:scaffold1137_cov392-Pavlova_lutheri.AAC.14
MCFKAHLQTGFHGEVVVDFVQKGYFSASRGTTFAVPHGGVLQATVPLNRRWASRIFAMG